MFNTLVAVFIFGIVSSFWVYGFFVGSEMKEKDFVSKCQRFGVVVGKDYAMVCEIKKSD